MAEESGLTLLIGHGEQYWDPEDWRELVRARRLRRGMDVAVREKGLTAYRPLEDIPGLAAILDELDPRPDRTTTRFHDASTNLNSSDSVAGPLEVDPSAQVVPVEESAPISSLEGEPNGASTAQAPADPFTAAIPRAKVRKRSPAGVMIAIIVGLAVLWTIIGGKGKKPAPPSASDAAATGPSFTCALAKARSATVVCGDAALEAADRSMADLYGSRMTALAPDQKSKLRARQRAWLARREGCMRRGKPRPCVAKAYDARIRELQNAAP